VADSEGGGGEEKPWSLNPRPSEEKL